jgi:aspartate aminotransferase-like enzyme
MVKPKYTLYTPGPVAVSPEVLRELSSGLVYHREASFTGLYESVRQGLQKLMLTKSDVHLLTSSGTGAMETAVCNLVNQGDKVLVATAGRFGERWRELCLRFGGFVDELSRPYGESIPPEELERRLRANESARCVFTTLTETSTGAVHDIKAYGDICHRLNRILVVDAVAGLGCDELRTDQWYVDVVVGGSQKGLGVPPGIGFIALNARAWEQVDRCKNVRYYFDLRAARKYAQKGQTPWTPAISIIYGMDLALKRIVRGGMPAYWKARKTIADGVRKRIAALKLGLFPQRPSNALTVIRMPAGVDGAKVVDLCKKRYKVLLANGQGDMRGKIVRIGHMGPVTKAWVDKGVRSFELSYKAVARGR